MLIKTIKDETFQDYKKASMFISTCFCDWKCCVEQNIDKSICQNSPLAKDRDIEYSISEIIDRYVANSVTSAIVIGGLEPMLQFEEVCDFIREVRNSGISDDIVIYTGYYPDEIEDEINQIKSFQNIIVKFGRYKADTPSKYDEVLGITLVSDNQFAMKIS
jgi:pyruvate-formate lyase-activating enzyme